MSHRTIHLDEEQCLPTGSAMHSRMSKGTTRARTNRYQATVKYLVRLLSMCMVIRMTLQAEYDTVCEEPISIPGVLCWYPFPPACSQLKAHYITSTTIHYQLIMSQRLQYLIWNFQRSKLRPALDLLACLDSFHCREVASVFLCASILLTSDTEVTLTRLHYLSWEHRCKIYTCHSLGFCVGVRSALCNSHLLAATT